MQKKDLLLQGLKRSAAMAMPIKETPFLRGVDAQRFHDAVKANVGKGVSKKEVQRISENFSKLKQIAKF